MGFPTEGTFARVRRPGVFASGDQPRLGRAAGKADGGEDDVKGGSDVEQVRRRLDPVFASGRVMGWCAIYNYPVGMATIWSTGSRGSWAGALM